MDDVGQTLLNWASAFGTLEMVGYLQLNRFENVFLGIFNKHWLYMYCLFCHMGGIKKIMLVLNEKSNHRHLDFSCNTQPLSYRDLSSELQ